MSRRIEVELTSRRDDGVWTWRAAGAKQPKGELDGGLLYEGAAVGDVVRADAEFYLDGIEILTVLAPKRKREGKVETIEVIGSGRTEELVTTHLAKKGGGRGGKGGRGGRDRKERGDRGDRDRGRNKRDDRGRPEGRRDDDRGGRARRDRGEGRERPQPEKDARPKPKRLRPKRVHRKALLDSLPAEQQAVAEQVLRGGLPAVRQALDKQNEEAKAEGRPEVNPAAILKMAEDLVPATRTAEWRDRAEAAAAEIDELDLRDIRSVINAAETAARDDETRALADQLRAGLARRAAEEHAKWLADLTSALSDGRLVRALRLSSHPPKAGAPLPADLQERLKVMTEEGLSNETAQQRYATVLDALAYSPIHAVVVPSGAPATPDEQLKGAVRKHAARIPQIAALFGIEPAARTRSRGKGRGKGRKKPPPPPPPTADAAASPDQPAPAPEGAPAPPPEAPAPEAVPPEAAAPEVETAPEAPEPESVGEPETASRSSPRQVFPRPSRLPSLRPRLASRQRPRERNRPGNSSGALATRSLGSRDRRARGFQPARTKVQPISSAQARSWVVSPTKTTSAGSRSRASSRGTSDFGPSKASANQADAGVHPSPSSSRCPSGPCLLEQMCQVSSPPRSSSTWANGWGRKVWYTSTYRSTETPRRSHSTASSWPKVTSSSGTPSATKAAANA